MNHKIVYVCAPLAGNISRHIVEAINYAKYVFKCGAIPIVPHFYALCLDDNNPKEREQGMGAGIRLLLMCDEMWIFGSEMTNGMIAEMKFCEETGIKMKHIPFEKLWDKLGGNYV